MYQLTNIEARHLYLISGEVTSLTGSELNSLLLSGGADGKTCIYDLNRRILVNHLQYGSSVTCLRWLPLEVFLDLIFVTLIACTSNI